MAKEISIVINLDTREGFNETTTASQANVIGGTKSIDFFAEGVKNKQAFFKGYDIETTVFVDIHNEIPREIEDTLRSLEIDNLVLSKHNETFIEGPFFPKWLDLNILNALIMARGKYVAHFDQDMATFRNDDTVIKEWIQWIDSDTYEYISYPSRYSPCPVHDPDFNYNWASTRFFFCKRETLNNYTEILKCLRSSEYLYGKYGEKKRKCPWLEHILGIIATPGKVFYPPMQPDRYMIFSWGLYHMGILPVLNNMPYENVVEYVRKCGGIGYPCDVRGREI